MEGHVQIWEKSRSHLTPHLVDLTPECALGELDLLVEEDAGPN